MGPAQVLKLPNNNVDVAVGDAVDVKLRNGFGD